MLKDDRVARTLLSANLCILTRTGPTRTVLKARVGFECRVKAVSILNSAVLRF
jgi:hypothetical protein